MKATWRLEPEERPNFTQLACLMGDFLEANVKQVILWVTLRQKYCGYTIY